MKQPDRVFTRQKAIVEAYGHTASETIEDSFDERGFVVLGDYRDEGELVLAAMQPVRTRIMWRSDEDRDRALRARNDDFNEMFSALPATPEDYFPIRHNDRVESLRFDVAALLTDLIKRGSSGYGNPTSNQRYLDAAEVIKQLLEESRDGSPTQLPADIVRPMCRCGHSLDVHEFTNADAAGYCPRCDCDEYEERTDG